MPVYVALAYAFARLLAGPRRWAKATIAALAMAAVATGCVTWRLSLTWRDTEALIGHAVEVGAISRPRYQILMGDFRERQNRIDEAERFYREAVRTSPSSAAAADALGSFLSRRGDPEAGFPWFERTIALDPRFVRGYNNIGLVLLRRGRLSEAARQFETAVRIHPFYIDARYNLARTLHSLGRFAEASENYALVLQGDPGHRRALAGLAELARGASPIDRNPGTSEQFARP
jgi:tetratricopeptide (TPR) repeat protein